MALAFAPLTVLKNSQFFFPRQNGRIALSEAYANIRISLRAPCEIVLNREGQLDVLHFPERGRGIRYHVHDRGDREIQWRGRLFLS